MKQQTRFYEIDMMRGIALISIILIHTCYFFISDHIAYTLWNYAQFSVPVFIFCSAFLYFQKEQTQFGIKPLSLSLYKRAKRLLMPYYIFLLFFIPLVFLQTPHKINAEYVFRSFLAYGGVDLSWLVLLFLYFSLLMPFTTFLRNNVKFFYFAFIIISALSSIVFLFFTPQFDFRVIMWLPWSLVIIFAYYFLKLRGKREIYYIMTLLSFIVYILLVLFLNQIGHSLSFTSNKYPPNIYYIIFGIFSTLILYKIVQIKILKRFIIGMEFFSKNSYSLFFIHYFILTALMPLLKPVHALWHWQVLFNSVLVLSVITQIALNKLKNIYFEESD